MSNKFYKIFIFACLSFLIFSNIASAADFNNEKIEIQFFYSKNCLHCEVARPFLKNLAQKYPQIDLKETEISQKESIDYFLRTLEINKVPTQERGFVPTIFINSAYVVGYQGNNTTGKAIEDYVKSLVSGEIDSKLDTEISLESVTFLGKEFQVDSTGSLAVMALIIGLADGVNPCMFSVLLMLLAYLLSISSPKKAFNSGILFSFFVFLIYFSLMLAIYLGLNLFQEKLLPFIGTIKLFLGIGLVAIAIWMIKDFFFLKKGERISFSIPSFAYPIIKKLVSLSTYSAVILLALFSSLIELPCTFALPLGYVAILLQKGVSPYLYLVIYNLFFILPLVFITCLVFFGFSKVDKIKEWRSKNNTLMRLISGALLLLLGLLFILEIF